MVFKQIFNGQKMDYKSFFEFSGNINSDKHFAYLDRNGYASDIDDKLLIGEYHDYKFPILFRQKNNHKMLDVVVTGATYLYLISERFKSILDENKLTGWKVFPIKLLDKNNEEISGYYGFSVYGRCGQVDYKKCSVTERKYVENGPVVKEYIGFPIDLEKWDKTDFFIPDGYFGIIITSNAANILNKSKITNIKLTSLADVVTPEFAIKNRIL